jgi:hypothetical protein
VTEYDVYVIFRKCQAEFNNRPYRLPKDWDKHFNKMSKQNREALEKSVRCFDTIWQNIDPERYFRYGFELFGKNFSYMKFFDKKLIEFYKTKDKVLKRKININKKSILKSAKFILNFMRYNNIRTEKVSSIFQYCNLHDGNISIPISHYLSGNINREVIIWLSKKGYLRISEEEKALIPYVTNEYRKTLAELELIDNFMVEFERILKNAGSKK